MAKLKFDFKKMDFTRVKQFLLAKGEKIVLGIVVLLLVYCVATGMMAANSADRDDKGNPLLDTINRGKDNIINSVKNAEPPKLPPPDTDRPWYLAASHLSVTNPYFQLTEPSDKSRRTPKILPIFERDTKIDYVKAGISAYQIDIDNQKATIIIPPGSDKKSAKLAQTILPRHMLIVSALFPIKEQTEEFIAALKPEFQALNPEDHPQLLGVNVVKIIRDEKGAEEFIPLYTYDAPNEKVVVAPNLDDIFRRAMLDPDALKPFANHRKFPGLITNVPKLASAAYPKLELARFKEFKDENPADNKTDPGDDDDNPPPKKDPKGIKPPPGIEGFPPPRKKDEPQAKEVALARVDTISWSKSPAKEKKAQFSGENYPIFDGDAPAADPQKVDPTNPMGVKPPFPDKFKGPPKGKLDPMMKFPGKNPPGKEVKEDAAEDSGDPLIRFFDIDVKAGYAYAYKIQVRIKNPNFGKQPNEVLLPEMAEAKELLSPWTMTPFTTVPAEVPSFYVLDQQYEPEVKEKEVKKQPDKNPMGGIPGFKDPPKGKDFPPKEKEKEKEKKEEKPKGPQPRGPDFAKADGERVPIQIHRWFDWADPVNQAGVIADWILAERLLVRRGEYIGRPRVTVEAPTWSLQKNTFELINLVPPDDPKKKSTAPKATGIQLDFTFGNAPPLVVDFDSGHHRLKGSTLYEESPIEMLLVTNDGKMIVRNSFSDSRDKVREDRYNVYRQRLEQFARPVVEEEPKEKDPKVQPKFGPKFPNGK